MSPRCLTSNHEGQASSKNGAAVLLGWLGRACSTEQGRAARRIRPSWGGVCVQACRRRRWQWRGARPSGMLVVHLLVSVLKDYLAINGHARRGCWQRRGRGSARRLRTCGSKGRVTAGAAAAAAAAVRVAALQMSTRHGIGAAGECQGWEDGGQAQEGRARAACMLDGEEVGRQAAWRFPARAGRPAYACSGAAGWGSPATRRHHRLSPETRAAKGMPRGRPRGGLIIV